MEVYLDNSATTKSYDEVGALVAKVMCESYGNPSSMHTKGLEAERYIREARESIARILKVNEKELYFTSGGTESDNLAIIGTAQANQRTGRHLITSKIEHPAVAMAMKQLEEQGFRITWLPVDEYGVVDLEQLEREIGEETTLVSVMQVNNEIGTVQPLEQISAIIKRKNPRTLFHVDGVQGFGKFRIFPRKMGIDLYTGSGHKIHGPKGSGFLYVADGVKMRPQIFGGGQQGDVRPGTENVPGIAGLGMAARMIYDNLDQKVAHMYELREHFIEQILALEDVWVNGYPDQRSAPHIVSVGFKGVRAEVVLHALEEKGIWVSSGSACASNSHKVSNTLRAIGIKGEQLESVLRFSFSEFTTAAELDYTVSCLEELLPMLRRYTRH